MYSDVKTEALNPANITASILTAIEAPMLVNFLLKTLLGRCTQAHIQLILDCKHNRKEKQWINLCLGSILNAKAGLLPMQAFTMPMTVPRSDGKFLVHVMSADVSMKVPPRGAMTAMTTSCQ